MRPGTMRLDPAPEALEFAAAVREMLADAADSSALRTAWEAPDGRVPGLWKRLAEVGLTGLSIDPEYGGAGMDQTAAVAVIVETGRAALPEPLVETLTGAALLSAAGGPVASEWLPRIANGDAVVAVALHPRALVTAADQADLLLVRDADGVVAVSPSAVSVTSVPALDKGIRLSHVHADAATGDRVADADSLAPDLAFDTGVVAVAAQQVGLGQAMLEMAVRYAGQREQFGKPIGAFQAVKHQLADAYVDLAFALPVVHRAAWSVAHDTASRARDASHAKLAGTRASLRAARTALQVHAGIGYTYEHDLHIWMKRTWSLASLWGDEHFHRARVAADLLDGGATHRVPG